MIAALIALAAPLAACGDGEAEQRKAFIGFLQDINGRSGVHFLVPTAADEKAFGPYLQQYAIIMDYDKDMKAPMDDFAAQIMKLGYGPASSSRAPSSRWPRRRKISSSPKPPSTGWSKASRRGWRK